jgi:hypothetical protein
MCGNVFDSGDVKNRKPRRCSGCSSVFPKGFVMEHCAMADMGSVSHAYWCPLCKHFFQEYGEDCVGEGELDDYLPSSKAIDDALFFNEGITNQWPRERRGGPDAEPSHPNPPEVP